MINNPKIEKIGLYLMTQCSVKVASGPLQARNGLSRFISLKISFVPHPSCDCTNYLTCDIKMTHRSYCTIFISLNGFKAELLTCKNVRAVTSGPLQFVHQINLMKLFLTRGVISNGNQCPKPQSGLWGP